MRKLDLHNQKALRYYAFQYGMLPSVTPQESTEQENAPETKLARGKKKE